MKVSEFLEQRRPQWQELDELCRRFNVGGSKRVGAADTVRLAELYRARCADLALAASYQLPQNTVNYLHRLVARGHNQLYRPLRFDMRGWLRTVLLELPKQLARDRFLHISFVLFWGSFLLAFWLSYTSPGFAERAVGKEMLHQIEEMYAEGHAGRDAGTSSAALGFYIANNTGIGLRCMAWGLLGGVGGLFVTVSNALFFGTLFGHMATRPERDNFFTFVTAHGPFELTAIVLSAAAGMRIGFAVVRTGGLTRAAAVRTAARLAMPTLTLAVFLFFAAALIESFLSPSSAPYAVKAAVAVISILLMAAYYFVLGRARGPRHAA